MSAQNAKGASFMDLFGTQLQAKLSRPVKVTTFADGAATSMSVLSELQDDPDLRAAVKDADVVVLSVGSNDVDPFGVFPKGTCTTSQKQQACLKAYAPALTGNYEGIFAELSALTKDHPPAVRVTSVDNPFVGLAEAPTPTFGRDFFAQVAEAETAALFSVATSHGARTVDYLHVFGGVDGLKDPAAYLAQDHSHPGDLGIQTIADLLTDEGIAP